MKKLKAILSDAGRASRLLAAGLAVFIVAGALMASTNYTVYTNLKVTALTNLVGAVTMNSTLTASSVTVTNTATAGALTVTGASSLGTVTASTASFTIRQSTAPSSSNAAVQLTPVGIGELVLNWTDKEVCVATGTSRLQWVKIATPTAACGH